MPASDRHLDEHIDTFTTGIMLSCVRTRAGETGDYDGKSQAPKEARWNSSLIAETFEVGKRKTVVRSSLLLRKESRLKQVSQSLDN